MDRRSFMRSSAALAAAGLPLAASAAGEVVVGSIFDLSGGLDIYGKPIADCMTLAVKEINAAGGLLGRRLRLAAYDPQSSMQLYTQFAQQAALREKAAVVFGGITSASREVIRPVLGRYRTPYFYGAAYEGGVCDRNTFCTGVTPAQAVGKLVPYAMKKWGSKVYVLAADYNYGQITSQWVRKFVADSGGTVASIDFFPLDVTSFGPTLSKIEAARPDLVVSALVGGAHMSFYRQWAAAGLNRKIPMASTTFGLGGEQFILAPNEGDGILVAYNYFPELDTPENRAFKARHAERFGQGKAQITDMAVSNYQAVRLWAEGVKRAGTLEREQVLAALESGIGIEGPSGQLTLDPQTHHCVMNISLAEVRNRQFAILESYPQQPPADTAAVCNLRKNPRDNQQYVIQI